MIAATDDVYEFVNVLIRQCREQGFAEIAQKLNDAMNLGSSAMEILGAIRIVLLEESGTIGTLVERTDIEEVIQFVNRTFGRE